MVHKPYRILLSEADRQRLTTLTSSGSAPARAQTHARILLKADQSPGAPAWTDRAICAALDSSPSTVVRVRRNWVREGFAAAIERRPARAHRARRLDGHQEAQLLALACSTPPPGQQRWSLRLLAKRAVELELVDGIAPNTVRSVLKKTVSSRT